MIELARFLYRAAKTNFAVLQRPYKLNYCITYWCQSRCTHCSIWQMRPKNELTPSEVEKVAEANGSGLSWLQLTGGEPFMRHDIDEIAKAFVDRSDLYILSTPTNSLNLPSFVEKRVKRILDLEVPHFVLTLSLDGWMDLHDQIRGIPGNYLKVMDTYRTLKDLQGKRFKIVFGYTLCKRNEGQLAATVKSVQAQFPEVLADDFHVNLAQNSANYYSNVDLDVAPGTVEALVDLKVLKRMKKGRRSLFNSMEGQFTKGLAYKLYTGSAMLQTKELVASCFLDSYGNVYPSIMSNIKLGSVRDSGYDLKPIWQGEAAKNVRAHNLLNNPDHWTSCEAYQAILGNL